MELNLSSCRNTAHNLQSNGFYNNRHLSHVNSKHRHPLQAAKNHQPRASPQTELKILYDRWWSTSSADPGFRTKRRKKKFHSRRWWPTEAAAAAVDEYIYREWDQKLSSSSSEFWGPGFGADALVVARVVVIRLFLAFLPLTPPPKKREKNKTNIIQELETAAIVVVGAASKQQIRDAKTSSKSMCPLQQRLLLPLRVCVCVRM
jgi:hypothetical protein